MPNPDTDAGSELKALVPEFVMFILNRLTRAGYPAFIVGGALRDACLSRPVTDWDIATSAPSEDIKKIFRDISRFSLKQGNVTLLDSGQHFHVTPFRGPTACIRDDLERRDFTMNAMAYNAEKDELLDYWDGRKDMARNLVRATGRPESRFREDPLRILRAVRFATELGFRIDAETQDAIVLMAGLLPDIAPERIRDELMKILLTPRPSMGFNLMRKTGLLEPILPEILEGYLKRQNSHHRHTIFRHIMETVDRTAPVPVLRLTALFHDIAKPRVRKKINGAWHFYGHEAASADLAEEIMRRLRFSTAMIRKVSNLIRHHGIGYHSAWTDGAVRRLIRRVGQDNIEDLLNFRQADIMAHGLHNQKTILLKELQIRVTDLSSPPAGTALPELAINGDRVMKILGIPPGPEVGRMLDRLVEKVMDTPELNTEAGLIKTLEHMKTIDQPDRPG